MKKNNEKGVRKYLGKIKYVMESSPGDWGCLKTRLGISSTDVKDIENRKWENTNKFLRWRGKNLRDFSEMASKCSSREFNYFYLPMTVLCKQIIKR